MSETMTEQDRLQTIVAWMRKNGVAHLSDGVVTITLDPGFRPAAPEASLDAETKPVQPVKRSARDGLTAEQQIELYGRVIDRDLEEP